MNPFASVWLHPKQTTRYIIENKTMTFSILIVILGLMSTGVRMFQDGETYPDIPYLWIFLATFIAAPLFGLIMYFVSVAVTYLIGKLLKGTGSFSNIVQACSMAYIPMIVLWPLYLIWLFSSPESFFLPDVTDIFSTVISLVSVIVSIWILVINVGAVSEAHQFSIIRAIITLIVPMLLILFFIFAVIAVIFIAIFGIVGAVG